ncbi:MFS transporter [Streptomyces sp. NBC_01477]|uniref:MFS transporter n=1 Tax=Streptomyces sp. NBC_01477 TaxID=2976015 RepID=UPI002E3681B6|nr:MFS transporter [Streptomyces sp. NBC_01477]
MDPPATTPGRVGPLLASTGISVTGDGAFLAAAPLLAASLTRNPLAVATVSAAFSIPWLIVGLPAGALADRWSRRAVMITADLLRAVVLTVLSVLVVTGNATLPLLTGTIMVVGIARCFFDASSQAVIPLLVGRDKETLTKVNGRYWAVDTVGRSLAGPPLGSGAYALSASLPFAADAASFVASAAFISRLPKTPAPGGHAPITAAIRAGLAHLLAIPDLRTLALSMSAYNFAYNMAMAPFVLYATGTLHVAKGVYGVLLAVAALGGIAAGWRAAPLTRRLNYRQMMAIAIGLQGLAWFGIAVVPNVFAVGAFLAVLGAASTLTSVAAGSARQALTPDDLLGRVVTAFRLFGGGAAGVGALTGGVIAREAGLRAPLWTAAAMLGLAALSLRAWRRHR